MRSSRRGMFSMRIRLFAGVRLALGLTLVLSSCVSFTGGEVGAPLFIASFRDGGTFPHRQPSDDVLLLDVTERADYFTNPPEVALRIDGTLVGVFEVEGGRNEIPFPPAAWTPTGGEHELEVRIADIARTLPFTWAD